MNRSLPIDELVEQIRADLTQVSRVVVSAPPGAGKSTRLPPALLDSVDGGILVTQPRRLAARMVAHYVARERNEHPGETVGYHVRFDEKVSRRTRITYMTEGVLLRRMLAQPTLEGIGCVILDEFHERHVETDVLLGLLRQLQEGARPDFKLLVMSATLDAGAICQYLTGSVYRVAEGRQFPVTIDYAASPDDIPLQRRIAAAVRDVLASPGGDILVFLPGAAEIMRADRECRAVSRQFDAEIVHLHGSLTPQMQDRAVRAGPKRKIILSTNIAETSVTIGSVTTVIDSGLARVAAHAPWSGLPSLRVSRVSQASATQRTGRAGRTGPGRCIRLYAQHDFTARLRQDEPEIRRADLSELSLLMHGFGDPDLRNFPWLDAPQAGAVAAASQLLLDLGAVGPDGQLSETGKEMLRYPLHPRLARVLVEAVRRGVGNRGAALVAIVAERSIWSRNRLEHRVLNRAKAESDPVEALEVWEQGAAAGFRGDVLRRLGLDERACDTVDRVQRQLMGLLPRQGGGGGTMEPEEALQMAILAGFPDRVATRRSPVSAELLLCAGGAARQGPESTVHGVTLVVVVDAEQSQSGTNRQVVARSLSRIEPEWLLELIPGRVHTIRNVVWDSQNERVWSVETTTYDQLTLEEIRRPPRSDERAAAVELLARKACEIGIGRFLDIERLEELRARIFHAKTSAPAAAGEIPEFGEDDLSRLIAEACNGLISFAELAQAGLWDAMLARMGDRARQQLDRLSPPSVRLPGGRSIRVNYDLTKPPWVESYIQDFFGMAETPMAGAVPLTVHLWAPNKRAVQVTRDLTGFWSTHYPAVRKELQRKYPRHNWPVDPTVVQPRMKRDVPRG